MDKTWLVSFEIADGAKGARRLIDQLEFPIDAVSLGGVDSLISRPPVHSHAGLSPEERREVGIADGLVRLSVGLEGTADLIADLEQALAPSREPAAAGA